MKGKDYYISIIKAIFQLVNLIFNFIEFYFINFE